MQLPHLLSRSSEPAIAQEELLATLAGIEVTADDLDQLLVEAALHSEQSLKTWADLIKCKQGKSFDAVDVLLKNSLMAHTVRSTNHCIIASSIFEHPPKVDETAVLQANYTEYTKFTLPNKTSLHFHNESYGASKDSYHNRFDFLSISPKTKGQFIASAAVPYQSIDYRICSALSDCGLLDRFADALAPLIEATGHDYIHSCLKNTNNMAIDRLVNRTNLEKDDDIVFEKDGSIRPSKPRIIGEELWALMTNSAVYDRMKNQGVAKQVAQQGAALYGIIQQFQTDSKYPDAENMAASLRAVVTSHISNYVKREKVAELVKAHDQQPSPQQLELLLLHGKPGNKIRRLPADRLRGDGMYDYDANTVVQRTLDMLFHCNYNSIYGFAAESFATVNAEFEKRPKLHPKLAELKDAISATHTHDDTLPPASIDPIRARFSAGAPKDSLLR